jgi:hypothetical protein
MIGFLPSLIAVTLTGVLVLGVAGIRRLYEARQARREAAARAFARHPAQLGRRPLRRRCPGLPIDGEPLSEEDLATYTAIMMTPPIGSTQARETSAGEETE